MARRQDPGISGWPRQAPDVPFRAGRRHHHRNQTRNIAEHHEAPPLLAGNAHCVFADPTNHLVMRFPPSGIDSECAAKWGEYSSIQPFRVNTE
jgi:hypothetical protein